MGLRQGERWDAGEYAQLADEISKGLTVDAIAVAHSRTPGGITSAAARMIPREERVRRRDAVAWLTERMEAGAYVWEPVLRVRLAEDGIRYWSADEDARLAAAWQNGEPIQNLTARFVASELALARRMIELQLAASLVEVAERLGATPGGQLDVRRQLAAPTPPQPQYVLVFWTSDGPLHLSTHPSPEAAAAARDRLHDAVDTAGETEAEPRWAIACREPGTDSGPTFSNQPHWHQPE